MKEKVYILADILPETQNRYPHINLRKFKILYDGWRAQNARLGRRSPYFTFMWSRGWLSPRDADSLRKYIGLE